MPRPSIDEVIRPGVVPDRPWNPSAIPTRACCCSLLATAVNAAGAIGKLTERERQVLALLGTGLPNRPLARRLSISERTAKAHVKSILDKLGIQTRLEAVLTAIVGHGLVPNPYPRGDVANCAGPSGHLPKVQFLNADNGDSFATHDTKYR
jgi:DNA-binding CsgD family transcriptional regulator